MSFDDLPKQSPINEKADAYGLEALRISRAVVEKVPCECDVPYGPDYWQKLDIFPPAPGAKGPVPILIYYHGGNFTHGYKEWCDFMAPSITSLPAVFVSASYRLRPEAPWPAAVDDGFATVAFMRKHAARYGGDPQRIFAGGHSAGGNLVALMALRHDWRKAAGLPDDALRAVFPLSGTYDTHMANLEAETRGATPPGGPDTPLDFAGQARIPFYVAWGGDEKEPVRRTGRAFADALAKTGVTVANDEIPGQDHFQVHIGSGDVKSAWAQRVRDWMTRY